MPSLYLSNEALFLISKFQVAKPASKFDKVVKREVCRVTTKGTKTFSFLSGECADSESTYLLSLAEKVESCWFL